MSAPESHSVKAETEYVVLMQREGSEGGWDQVGPASVLAHSAGLAIKTVALNRAEGVYVAVPVRSWNPIRVTAKVETTLVLEDAES